MRKKRILAVLMAVLMIVTLLPSMAWRQAEGKGTAGSGNSTECRLFQGDS